MKNASRTRWSLPGLAISSNMAVIRGEWRCRRLISHPPAMSPLPIFLVAAVLSVSVLRAAESTELALETRPFVIRHSFTANALPKAFTLLELKAEAWSEFAITSIATHGSRVAKGETLVAFDPQGIDRKIEDTARAIDTKTLEIAQAEHDLKNLEETTSAPAAGTATRCGRGKGGKRLFHQGAAQG
jgi:hypothetical protein